MADGATSYLDDAPLVEDLTIGLQTHPQAAANALKAIVEEARRRAAAGEFLLIRNLADRADDALAEAMLDIGISDDGIATLATLAGQVFAVLALMGGSDGRRDSGYYRAPLAHAQRLDAMTGGVLRLVDLVNLIGNDSSAS